jgi:hypothetical protein
VLIHLKRGTEQTETERSVREILTSSSLNAKREKFITRKRNNF